MELKFLGRGSAFNPKEGNTSAYFIDNNELFLIDCGENIFARLLDKNLLEKVDSVNIIITHTHSDHVGSLGTLILYLYYNLKKRVNILVDNKEEFVVNINDVLRGFGIGIEMYNYVNVKELDNKYNGFSSIRYIATKHCKEINSYSVIFNTNNGVVFYSGDTSEIDTLESVLNKYKDIDKIYMDVSSLDFDGNPHININELNNYISDDLKHKVYCMHFNNDICIEKVIEAGFNVVEIN